MKLSDFDSFNNQCDIEWEEDQLFEMANIHDNFHGISDIVIWVGMANKRHGLRIKVSNMKNRFDMNNHFIIRMPSLDYDPSAVAKWITKDKMNAIFQWIKINQQLLVDYETGTINDTNAFMSKLSKI